jgi:uncharacterized protein (TIGR02300 family)
MAGPVKSVKHALTGYRVRGKPTGPKSHPGKTTLIKPDLGTKRVCPSCAARFYDLQKRPIECPKCAFTFEPEMLLKQRRTRVPEAAKPPAAVVEPEEEEVEDAEDEELEDAEAAADDEELEEEEEVPEADEPLIEADEEGEEGETVAPEEPVEPEEFEEEIEDEEEEDDNLLEEVEEDEDDVSGIIDADIEKDEP